MLIAATVVFFLAAPYIIDLYTVGSHGPAIATERQVATYLLRLFSPQLLAYGAISLMTAVLNTARRFSAPAFTPILNNVVAIAILLAFAAIGHTHSLAAGRARPPAPAPARRRHDARGRHPGRGPRPEPAVAAGCESARAGDPTTPPCGRSSTSPAGPSGSSSPINWRSLSCRRIAVSIGAATLTAYTYASTFFQLPFGIVAVSVMTTIAPVLASRFTKGDMAGFARAVRARASPHAGRRDPGCRRLPASGPAGHLAHLPRGGERAPSGGAHLTATMLELLALGLPGFCIYLLAILAFQAMRDTRTPFFLYLLENGLNIVLAFVFRSTLGGEGACPFPRRRLLSRRGRRPGDALRTRVGGLGGLIVGRYVVRTVICSLVMAFVVALVLAGVGSDQGIGLLERVVAGVVAGIVAYALAAGLAGSLAGWQTSKRRHASARERATWPG